MGAKRGVDATHRSQQYLNINREVSQVATDYKVLSEGIKMLKKEHVRLRNLIDDTNKPAPEERRREDGSVYCFNNDLFDQFQSQVDMIQTYSNLYVQRAIIGMNEVRLLIDDKEHYRPMINAGFRTSQPTRCRC